MLMAGVSGEVIFAGRENRARISPSGLSPRVHPTLALLIQHLALPSGKREFADLQKVKSLK
jgi:hypothetical protein